MQPVHVLVDLENNQPTLEDVQRLVPDITDAWLFHSPQLVKRLASFAPMGLRHTPVPISRPGKNALDFHLAFYVGYIAARNPGAKLVIVAIDRGYGPMKEHATELGFEVTQVPFNPGAKPARKAATKKASASKARAKKAPLAKAATNRAPAKRVAAKKASAAEKPVAKKARSPEPALVVAKKAVPARKTPPMKPVKAPASEPASKKTAIKVATAKAQAPATDRSAGKTNAVTSPLPSALPARGKQLGVEKVVANLRNMGEKRPKKLKQLRRHLSSLLGKGEGDSAVATLLANLLAADAVRLSADAVVYGRVITAGAR
jgi:hypothetical protein